VKRPDLLEDARFGSNPERVEHRRELHEELAGALQRESSGHWLEVLSEHGVPVTPIQSIEEVVSHEQVAAIGAIADLPHPHLERFRVINTPIQIDGAYYPVRRVPPAVGEHSEEIRAEVSPRQARGRPPGTRE
jgi:crotonobetainyl-CoA:carnitine CoA-transferase CaiB-like acyl-CoA transferase